MTKQEFEINKLIIVAVGKLFSDQSTYMLNEMKHRAKFDFNVAINSVDRFTKEIENKLSPEDNEKLQILTDSLNDALAEMRKMINPKVEAHAV